MMPTMGTSREERSETRRRNRKKTMVPAKAMTTAPTMRMSTLARGATAMTRSSPSPAHSVVPVVVGSTKRFWVMSCMTRPDMDMAAPARTRAMVRGTRTLRNISPPSLREKMEYSPVRRLTTSRATTIASPASSPPVSSGPRVRVVGSVVGLSFWISVMGSAVLQGLGAAQDGGSARLRVSPWTWRPRRRRPSS